MCSWGKLLGRPPAGGVYTKNSSAGGNGWPEGKNMDMGKYGTTNKGNETWVREIPVIYRPFFNGFGGFFAGSAERGRWAGRQFAGAFAVWWVRELATARTRKAFGAVSRVGPRRCSLGRRWAGRAQGGGGGGGGVASRKFAPRCEPHPARAVGPDDTDELRDAGCVVGTFYGNLGSPPSQAGDTKRRRPKCRDCFRRCVRLPWPPPLSAPPRRRSPSGRSPRSRGGRRRRRPRRPRRLRHGTSAGAAAAAWRRRPRWAFETKPLEGGQPTKARVGSTTGSQEPCCRRRAPPLAATATATVAAGQPAVPVVPEPLLLHPERTDTSCVRSVSVYRAPNVARVASAFVSRWPRDCDRDRARAAASAFFL
eukprot:gene21721-biopygen16198